MTNFKNILISLLLVGAILEVVESSPEGNINHFSNTTATRQIFGCDRCGVECALVEQDDETGFSYYDSNCCSGDDCSSAEGYCDARPKGAECYNDYECCPPFKCRAIKAARGKTKKICQLTPTTTTTTKKPKPSPKPIKPIKPPPPIPKPCSGYGSRCRGGTNCCAGSCRKVKGKRVCN